MCNGLSPPAARGKNESQMRAVPNQSKKAKKTVDHERNKTSHVRSQNSDLKYIEFDYF